MKKNEIDQQREMLRRRLDGVMDEDERQRLMKSLDGYEEHAKESLRNDTEAQNDKLKKALEARKNKRRKLQEKVNDSKQKKIFDNYANQAG